LRQFVVFSFSVLLCTESLLLLGLKYLCTLPVTEGFKDSNTEGQSMC
jgi:hypothetical protein